MMINVFETYNSEILYLDFSETEPRRVLTEIPV